MQLAGKKIILGVTGSIAAYKAVSLLRLLVKEGASVQVIMTPTAREFVGPVTFSALSGKTVLSDFFSGEGGDWNSHVDMGVSADLMLIAPITATSLGKMVSGIADNLLITTYLSARCPVVVAPAMDMDMLAHPSTQANLEAIRKLGHHVVEPRSGELASGLEGKGRMEEPENILQYLLTLDDHPAKKKLLNKRVLITAGPTHESIDPVRYMGNHSTGKMGYAIADAFARHGAQVSLVSGPVGDRRPAELMELIPVNTAAEMYHACLDRVEACDIAVFSAAVADFTPLQSAPQKVKRGKEHWVLELQPTKDIAAELGKQKRSGQCFVGFALESEKGLENARSKLERKNLDLVLLNMAGEEGAGFGTDTNRVTFIDRKGGVAEVEQKPKSQVAEDLVMRVINIMENA